MAVASEGQKHGHLVEKRRTRGGSPINKIRPCLGGIDVKVPKSDRIKSGSRCVAGFDLSVIVGTPGNRRTLLGKGFFLRVRDLARHLRGFGQMAPTWFQPSPDLVLTEATVSKIDWYMPVKLIKGLGV